MYSISILYAYNIKNIYIKILYSIHSIALNV